MNWLVRQVKVKDLKLLPNNPRTISEKEYKKLVDQIKKDGNHGVLVVDTDNFVLSGNQRLKAFQELNVEVVDVKYPERRLTDEERKRVVLSSNVNNGEHDYDILANEFEETIRDLNLNIDLSGLEQEIEEDDYNPEEVEKNIHGVARGDIWQLGKHRLMCGDSTSIEDVEKLMDGQKAHMVFTDPPYNTGMTAQTQSAQGGTLWKGSKKTGEARLSHMFDDLYTVEEWDKFLRDIFTNYLVATKEEAAMYVCIDWRRVADIKARMEEVMKVSNVIVWDKVVHGLGSDYKYTYELIVVGKKGKPEINNRFGEEYQDVWHVQRKIGKNEDHATAKPVELCVKPIKHASKQDDIVLDLFGGSGSTLIACEKTNRKCYMMELDEHYCSVIIDRWQKLTGEQAKRL